jgi:hypothetical protein
MSVSVTVLDENSGLTPDAADRTAALLYTLTDLYVLKPTHSPEEERQFTELAIRLIDAVDIPTRLVVAQRLQRYEQAPRAVLQHLEGGVPATVETPSPSLADGFSATMPTEPETADPSQHPDARRDPNTLAAEAAELIELFFTADTSARKLILQNIDLAPIAPAEPLHEAHAREAARRLEVAALARSPYEFATILVGTLGITQTLAVRIAQDPSGEPLIVAARALAVPTDILQRIVLFLNPAVGESVERVYDLIRLHDEIAPETARRMVTVWRMASAARMTRHQPLHHDDERRRARAEAAANARRFVNSGLERARRPA